MKLLAVAASLLLSSATVATAQQATEQSPIQDNSFLIEEAYNEEAGIVQHIF